MSNERILTVQEKIRANMAANQVVFDVIEIQTYLDRIDQTLLRENNHLRILIEEQFLSSFHDEESGGLILETYELLVELAQICGAHEALTFLREHLKSSSKLK